MALYCLWVQQSLSSHQAIFGGRFQYYLVLVCIPGCLADKAVSFRLALLEHESSHIVSIEWDPMALKLH